MKNVGEFIFIFLFLKDQLDMLTTALNLERFNELFSPGGGTNQHRCISYQ